MSSKKEIKSRFELVSILLCCRYVGGGGGGGVWKFMSSSCGCVSRGVEKWLWFGGGVVICDCVLVGRWHEDLWFGRFDWGGREG